jgi:transcriptional regulator with XRE-family HTH domain
MTKRAQNAPSTRFVTSPGLPPAVAGNINRLRTDKGLSLLQLAQQSGIALESLTEVEAGTQEPTIKTLWSLANALGVPFSALIANTRPSSVPPAPHARSREAVASKDGARRAEVYEIELPPHGAEIGAARVQGALENALVTAGSAEIIVGDRRYQLATGESASFAADVQRRYISPDAAGATLYLTISEPEE